MRTSRTTCRHHAGTVAIVAYSLLFAACAGNRPAVAVPKVVFIVLDGIPADVVESVPTPNLDAIAAIGGYSRAWVGGTVGQDSETPTVSGPSYASLVTGTWVNKHNVRDNAIEAPDYTYWDIFRIAKANNPSLATAIFSTWTDNRIKLLGDGLPAAGGNKLDYHFDGLELDTERFPEDEQSLYIKRIDELVAADAARHILETGPDLSWVYLQYTDDIAHLHGDSPELAAALQLVDQQVGLIFNAVRKRETLFDEDWLIVVTTDHGRDAETGKDHGGQSERERTIWIVTNSARLNERFEELPAIVDILPSIARHLGLTIPNDVAAKLDGRTFID